MVMLPPGRFMMGSPDTEPGQTGDTPGYRREGPQRSVTIPQPFAIGKYETTRAEFAQFIKESGDVEPPLSDIWLQALNNLSNFSLKNSGYKKLNEPPAIYVNLPYAEKYVDWLSKKTGKNYRLPTEAEWEYAARAGTQTARYWGDKSDCVCRYANVADRSHDNNRHVKGRYPIHKCTDGYAAIAPVGCFEPNQFGLYDMIGNVWEWTTTRWTFTGLFEEENTRRTIEEKELYILKGGSCNTRPRFTRSAYRIWAAFDTKDSIYGFRVVRDK